MSHKLRSIFPQKFMDMGSLLRNILRTILKTTRKRPLHPPLMVPCPKVRRVILTVAHTRPAASWWLKGELLLVSRPRRHPCPEAPAEAPMRSSPRALHSRGAGGLAREHTYCPNGVLVKVNYVQNKDIHPNDSCMRTMLVLVSARGNKAESVFRIGKGRELCGFRQDRKDLLIRFFRPCTPLQLIQPGNGRSTQSVVRICSQAPH